MQLHVVPQIWIDIVDGKNVSAETTVLRGKGNGSRRQVVPSESHPRCTNGKGNSQQLKTSMLAMGAETCNASVRPPRNRARRSGSISTD
jgi:hypothetical protein